MTTSARSIHSDDTLLIGRPARQPGRGFDAEPLDARLDERWQPTLRSPEQYGPYADRSDDDIAWAMSPERRAGPPLVNRRRRTIRRAMAAGAIALASGWAIYDWHNASAVAGRAAATLVQFAGMILERPPPPAAGSAETASREAAPLPLHEAIVEEKPATTAAQAYEPAGTVLPESPSAAQAEPAPAASAPPEPLPPPPPASSLQPHQRRAAAAGLHTELSRVLLESLSDTDYRNATIAIGKALARPSDDAVLIWPLQPGRGLAQFKVHFVRGAIGCRRYVVTVAKLGWLTTALPLERCGKARRSP